MCFRVYRTRTLFFSHKVRYSGRLLSLTIIANLSTLQDEGNPRSVTQGQSRHHPPSRWRHCHDVSHWCHVTFQPFPVSLTRRLEVTWSGCVRRIDNWCGRVDMTSFTTLRPNPNFSSLYWLQQLLAVSLARWPGMSVASINPTNLQTSASALSWH